MKHHLIAALLGLLISAFAHAQANPLDIFRPLEGYTWRAEGLWGDGSAFVQEIEIEFSLQNSLVTVQSQGFTNSEQTTFGLRNHGIRQYDAVNREIRFWEFDVFGGLTEGTVYADGKDLVYVYDYGGTPVTEMWVYKNERTYDFMVGVYQDGEWVQTFLKTEFVATEH